MICVFTNLFAEKSVEVWRLQRGWR